MNDKEPMTPRDAYQAYLQGAISPTEAEQAVQTWYSSTQPPAARPQKKD